jgi:hypothetical protein
MRLEVAKMSALLSLIAFQVGRNGGVVLACYGISTGFRLLSETNQWCPRHSSGTLLRIYSLLSTSYEF